MATTPVAYNPGSPISGTTQVGDLAIGTTPQAYSLDPGDVTWWMGPEDLDGFVIAVPAYGNTQPTPIPFTNASVGFYKSEFKTADSFISLSNTVFLQNFTNATSASDWLTANGFWNSYTSSFVVGIGPYFLQYSYTPATGNGWITFPNHNASTYSNDPNLIGQSGYAIYINPNDYSGSNNTAILNNLLIGSGTLTLTQGSSNAVYAFSNPNGFENTNYGGEFYWDNTFEGAQLGTLTLITGPSSPFNNVDEIFITVS